ncbi:MAG: hypothetical protein JWO03_2046 [Bacteroidetes bacterium]|nr:hypothetical protein [Bacteroidota bacterium]
MCIGSGRTWSLYPNQAIMRVISAESYKIMIKHLLKYSLTQIGYSLKPETYALMGFNVFVV